MRQAIALSALTAASGKVMFQEDFKSIDKWTQSTWKGKIFVIVTTIIQVMKLVIIMLHMNKIKI